MASVGTKKNKSINRKDVLSGLYFAQGVGDALISYGLGESQYDSFMFNAKIAEIQAEDAKQIGKERQRISDRNYAQLKGSQRASFAARGVEVNSGTASAVQKNTEMIRGEDSRAIQNSAFREAWGHSVRASDNRLKAKRARSIGTTRAIGSLISGGMHAIKSAGYFG